MAKIRPTQKNMPSESSLPSKSRIRHGATLTARRRPTRVIRIVVSLGSLVAVAAASGGWLAYRAQEIKSEMLAASDLLPQLESQLLENNKPGAEATLAKLTSHTTASHTAANDPLWLAAGALPLIGGNFSAITELSSSAVDIVDGAALPIVKTLGTINSKSLTPVNGRIDLTALSAASPSIISATNTLQLTHNRLTNIDNTYLVPAISEALKRATNALEAVGKKAKVAADTSRTLPSMLGAEGARNYLILLQNSAEVRATGGLSGALAVLSVKDGAAELTAQSSGTALGKFTPQVVVDRDQAVIYSNRLGTYIGDINLTPDFPTVARSAKQMWETRHGGHIDGVIALDPVVLAHVLEASGPLTIGESKNKGGLPDVLTSENVVRTLLSDVYSDIEGDRAQDAYFASVSAGIFKSLSSGQAPGDKILTAFSKSVEEERIRVWSAHTEEQKVLNDITLGGTVSGPVAGGTAFGVYFNDGTGAKMDYYVRRTVQLQRVCTHGDYAEFKVKVKLSNTAPSNASDVLPAAVTGAGIYGVPPGSVQTNIVVYGPALAHIDTAIKDNEATSFGSYFHDDRPVGVVATRIGPGQSSEVEMTFVNVIQHDAPKLSVTPTVQDVKDVTLPTEYIACG